MDQSLTGLLILGETGSALLGDAVVGWQRAVSEFPGDSAGGRELAVDPDLADAVGVVSASPEMVLAGPIDLGFEASLAMITNTDAQCPSTPSSSARKRRRRSTSPRPWRVGLEGQRRSGEDGGLTLLCGPDVRRKRRMIRALRETDPLFLVVPSDLSRQGRRVGEA